MCIRDSLSVARCVKPVDFGEVKSRQIHIFSDASNVGYGSAAYQRLCDSEGRTHCSFLMGKAHLAPIKAVTVPRLKLTGATVSVRLGEIIKKELDDKAETIQYHPDSVTVLRYIANDQKRFHVYVANRVQLIRNLSDPNQWRYVNTKENNTLTEQQQWVKFLWQPEKEWPAQPTRLGEIPKDDVEVKDQVNVCATAIVS